MLVIGVSGLIGAGKDTFADYLKGFKKIVFGDLIREDAKKHNLKPTRKVLQDLQAQRIKEHGKYYWPQKVINCIKESKSEKVVIAGFRKIEDPK